MRAINDMVFIRRLMFMYFMRRCGYHPILLPPIPNQVFSEPGPYPGAPQQIKVKHGSRWEEFKFNLKMLRWKVENRIDEMYNFQNLRIEWLGLRERCWAIEEERKNVGTNRKR